VRVSLAIQQKPERNKVAAFCANETLHVLQQSTIESDMDLWGYRNMIVVPAYTELAVIYDANEKLMLNKATLSHNF
jgi:hypothetical protein